MEGSTWNDYRWKCYEHTEAFFLEPQHRNYYHSQVQRLGFSTIGTYVTYLDSKMNHYNLTEFNAQHQKLWNLGYRCRSFNVNDIEGDINQLTPIIHDAFKNNFLFTDRDKTITKEALKKITN